MGVRGEGGGPGDVAMAVDVESIAGFGENPTGAGVGLAKSEKVGGDVEAEAHFGAALAAIAGDVARDAFAALDQFGEGISDEVFDNRLAEGGAGGGEFAEAAADVFGFEVDAFDFVVFAAAFDGGP